MSDEDTFAASTPVSILVAEDSPTQANYVAHVLERQGYGVTVAANGREALEQLKRRPADIVISSILMPEMNGYELCSRIRLDETLKETPVILTTLLADPKEVIRALEAGADHFVRKPFDEEDLLSRVRQAIANRELRRQVPPEDGLTVYFDNHSYLISSDRTQAMDLLLSTYQSAVEQNKELARARDALSELNDSLENRALQRTANLSAEIERRKAVERQLEEERNLLRAVLDAIPDPICLKDRNLKYVIGNASFLRSLHAYAPLQLRGKTDFDFFPRDLAVERRALDLHVLAAGLPNEMEERRSNDGKRVELRTVRVPVRNEEGEISALLVIHWDVTNQKRTEERVQRESEQLRTLVDNLPDLIYFKDAQLRFVLSNRAHLRFLGLAAEGEIIGKTDATFYPPDMARAASQRERRLLDGGGPTTSFEEEIDDQKGEVHVLDTRQVAIFSPVGEPVGLVGIGRDITEEKRLRAHLVDLAKFPSEDPNPIVRVSSAGRILYANSGAALLVSDSRFSHDGVLGEKPRRFIEECLAAGESSEHEAEFSERHFRLVIVPVVSRGYANVYGFDITEKKILERQLLQASKMEAIGRIAGGLAHDFNNMMQIINGYAEYLTGKLAENDPARTTVAKIREAGEKAAAMTSQLLAFSRKRTPKLQSVDLASSVANLEGILEHVLSHKVKRAFRFDPGLWPVRADAAQIDQMVLNLVINARDAMPDGGTLTIETRNLVVDATYVGEQFEIGAGDYVRLTVADSGAGMDESTRSKIFEPFFTTKDEGVGTGLGLAVVYAAVRDAKGDVRVISAPGGGTTFEILLPRAPGGRDAG